MIQSSETGFTEDKKTDGPSDGDLAGQPQSPVAALEQQIKGLEDQLKEKDAKYVYLYAEFENFKKRAQRERSDLIKFGWESVARDLLETADNLELAISHTPADTDKTLIDGLKLVLNQFKSAMQKQGVQSIESLNKPFDPNLHEAVGQEKSDLPVGIISKELSSGYTLHGRLLRPARVILSDGPEPVKDQK
ncbi:MAG: nucleotide exchange factor GrpE [Bdellovibrionia bacterium]